MGYFKDTVKGISWMASLRLITRIFTFVRIAIIARILTPSQFGLFGIASLVLSLIEILTETGINVFLIQEKREIKKYLDTAWIISIVRGVLITLSIIIITPFIVMFFNVPDILSLLLFISIVPLIRGFINPSVVKFQKNLLFHKEFYFRTSLFFIDSLISVILAFITRDVSSFVWGLVVSAFFEAILSFLIIKPTPVLKLNFHIAKEIISCGKWVTASGIFNYIFSNGDNIVVGKLLGTASLGLYQTGYKISTLPISEVSDVIAKVTFPVFVKISSDYKRLKKAFIKSILIVFLFTIPFGLILFIYTKEIVNLVLGEQWLDVIPAVKVLAIFGIVRTVSGYCTALFLGVKKQKFVTIVTFVSAFGLMIVIVPLVLKFGIVGAAFSALIGSILSIPFFVYLYRKIFNRVDKKQ